MQRPLLWLQLALAAAVALGVWVQVYLIAADQFGAASAGDLHSTIGEIIRGVEVLVFLAALGAWWRDWGKIGHAFGLAAIGTIQISLTSSGAWVAGLHGLLALVLLVMAVFVVKWNAAALGLTGASGGGAGAALPRPQP